MEDKKKLSLVERIVIGFKRLHYDGVSDQRVLTDFKYLNKNGQNSLFRYLVENPVFEFSGEFYQSRNWNYFMFLYDKANSKKLPKEMMIPRAR